MVLLIAATVAEQLRGTDFAVRWFYTAPWTIALWALAVVFGVWHLCNTIHTFTFRSFTIYLLHFSFVVILAGALTTHLFGTHTDLHLRVGETTEQYVFPLTLHDFRVVHYPGTDTPADYVADLSIGEVSMNHPVLHKGYRFFLSSYDNDNRGCVFIVRHDPAGTTITYIGYILLLTSFLLYLFVPKDFHIARTHKCSDIKSYLCKPLHWRGWGGLILLVPVLSFASPSTLPKQQAQELGNLCVFYNGRIEPLSCLATDFTEKLCGATAYNDYSAEQVYAGWLLAPYTWLDEPMIRLKSADARALQLPRDASYNQLFALKSAGAELPTRVAEKYALIGMLLSGELTRIYPYRNTADSTIEWLSYSSTLPLAMEQDDYMFVKKSVDYMGELFFMQDYAALSYTIEKTRLYQQKRAGVENLPSKAHFRAEQLWAKFPYTKPLALLSLTLGLLFFLVYCIAQGRGKTLPRWWQILNTTCLAAIWLFLTAMLIWRWYISGHIPLSNGHETMQVLAWFIMLLGLIPDLSTPSKGGANRVSAHPLSEGAGGVLLLASMPLMVSMMSASNPQITYLTPVLQSPLLSLHVSIIMLSYALLAFVMLNSVLALCGNAAQQQRQMAFSQQLLRPAVGCLAIGIFLGAVWANVSWGRYWGWDPKEVWALITLLVYAAPLHAQSLPFFRRPRVFHIYCLLAFLSVLFTYFGVNFLLGGLHSYA